MLLAALFFSVAFTGWCIYAEVHPPKTKEIPKPTPAIVEMAEDNDFDEDPPTVVAVPRKVPHDVVVNHRVDLNWWNFVTPKLQPLLLRISQFTSWLGTL
jgi:hypothetical protein